jgi:hypothetical protein
MRACRSSDIEQRRPCPLRLNREPDGEEASQECSPFESVVGAEHPRGRGRLRQERVAGIERAVFASRLDHVNAPGAVVDGRRLLS